MNHYRRVVSLFTIVLVTFFFGSVSECTPSTPEPKLGTTIVHPLDGSLMVYVPKGFFTMGMNIAEANMVAKMLGAKDYQELWMWETFPKRLEYTKGFFIDKYEVTIQRWNRFIASNPKFVKRDDAMKAHYNDPVAQVFPVASIHWEEAQRYANWCGKRLPTEKQWEKAARGTDGRLFPWGDTFDLKKGLFRRELNSSYYKRPIYTRVGRYPEGASPCGAMDMLGNQYEITSEWVEPYPNNPEREKMLFYSGQRNYCLRGGSWYHGVKSIYAAKRMGFPQKDTHYHVAFRTVWEPPVGYFNTKEFVDAKAAVLAKTKLLKAAFASFDTKVAQAKKE